MPTKKTIKKKIKITKKVAKKISPAKKGVLSPTVLSKKGLGLYPSQLLQETGLSNGINIGVRPDDRASREEKKPKISSGMNEEITKKPKTVKEEEIFGAAQKTGRYIEAVGRRKTSVARVRLYTKKEGFDDSILINNKPYKEYFAAQLLQKTVESPLEKMKLIDRFVVTVHTKGGGIRGQSEAVRHGIALALVKFNPDFKKRLRRAGFITRDPRMVERKKYGLKKARRAPQWSKR